LPRYISLEEKIMIAHLRPAILMLAILTLLTGIIYPLAITGIGQLVLPGAANGSMLIKDGSVIGSTLIGQAWTSDKYFWGRPSAAGDGYNAAASSGSNLGPTSQKLMDRIKADAEKLHQTSALKLLPADAVTASGSGLDPDISPDFAMLQVARIAKARNLGEDQVKAIVAGHLETPSLGVFGEPRVNVLLLNMALDGLNSNPNG
jgi:potassium-transporting ATPase KdpC subunit